MAFTSGAANQRLPSGPAVMPKGPQNWNAQFLGKGNSVKLPAVVMRPILPSILLLFPLPLNTSSVNQRLPSGPAVMPSGRLPGTGNKVMLPLGVMRPIAPALSVNQRLPSGPLVMPKAVPEGTLNSVTVPAAAQVGAVLRLSRPTPAIRAVRSATRRDRHPERFMLLPPWCLTENDLRGTNPDRTGQLTVMLNCWEACAPVLSVTVSVNVNVPFVVGVPLMVVPPFDPLTSARPGGSCPAVIDQV